MAVMRGDEVETYMVPVANSRETNDGVLAREWAVAGYGIAMKSVWDIGADLRAGRLTVVMPQWRSTDAPVHALYQRSRYMAPRVRALLDFLVERFSTASSDLGAYRILNSLIAENFTEHVTHTSTWMPFIGGGSRLN
jgi:DNA-binding transcriptional LysR family regulator